MIEVDPHGAAGPQIRVAVCRVELCFGPAYASWANPIEARFGPLRQFTVANSTHRNHPCRPALCTPTQVVGSGSPSRVDVSRIVREFSG